MCASPAYLRRFGTPATPDAIAGHRGLLYSNADELSFWEFLDHASSVADTVEVPWRLRINSGEALRDAAIAGWGITRLPTFIVHDAVRDGRSLVLPQRYEAPPVAFHASPPPGTSRPGRAP